MDARVDPFCNLPDSTLPGDIGPQTSGSPAPRSTLGTPGSSKASARFPGLQPAKKRAGDAGQSRVWSPKALAGSNEAPRPDENGRNVQPPVVGHVFQNAEGNLLPTQATGSTDAGVGPSPVGPAAIALDPSDIMRAESEPDLQTLKSGLQRTLTQWKASLAR